MFSEGSLISKFVIHRPMRSIVDVYFSIEGKHRYVKKQNELREVGRRFNFVKNYFGEFLFLGGVCWFPLDDNFRMVIFYFNIFKALIFLR